MRVIRARKFRACSPTAAMVFRNSLGFLGSFLWSSSLSVTHMGYAPGRIRLRQMARGAIACSRWIHILGQFLLQTFVLRRMLSHNKSFKPTPLRGAA